MRIVKKEDKLLLFEDIEPGDVFEVDGGIYMKTTTTASSLNNAVDLFDGEIVHFADEKKIYSVTCELVIE